MPVCAYLCVHASVCMPVCACKCVWLCTCVYTHEQDRSEVLRKRESRKNTILASIKHNFLIFKKAREDIKVIIKIIRSF